MGDGQELFDRAERKAVAERMRRGEPAPTAERASIEQAMSRSIVRAWWTSLVWVAFGLLDLLLAFNADHAVPRVLGVTACVGCLGLAAWRELHRRGAARLLDANRQRWGDL